MSDLADRIRATEIQLEAAQLEERFARNLEMLRQVQPTEYARYRSWQPRAFHLRWLQEMGTTVVDGRSGHAIYPGTAEEHARRQVEAFLASPSLRRCRFQTKDTLQEEKTVHPRWMNRAVRALHASGAEDPAEPPAFIQTLFVFGLGLGHHLRELLERVEVRHLCVVEPEIDLVHASLHALEWIPIVEYFSHRGRSLELVAGLNAADSVARIEGWVDSIGGFNLVQPWFFEHLRSETLHEIGQGVLNVVIPRATGSLGFFDDERIGLAHTVANLDADRAILRDTIATSPRELDRPVYVVANGPSLDDAIDTLRANRDHAVLVSCGTALGSLVKAGLEPDLHVEMERTRPVIEWITQATTQKQRDRIRLIALNTVHPEVFDLFPKSAMAMKPNDLGSLWTAGHLEGGGPLATVVECNPTVGNCGLAVVTALGFTDVTVFGMDLGYPAGGRHHSSLSLHYEVAEDQHDQLGVYRHDDPANPIAHGNFGGEVVTTPVYITAARAVGMLAARHPAVTIRNTAHGLLMPGTRPTPLDEVQAGEAFDTRAYLTQVLDGRVRRGGVLPTRRSERDALSSTVRGLARELREVLETPVDEPARAMFLLMVLHTHLAERSADPDSSTATMLLRGSVAQFSLLLAKALHLPGEPAEAMAAWERCRELAVGFLADVEAIADRSELWALDARTRDLENRIRKTAHDAA